MTALLDRFFWRNLNHAKPFVPIVDTSSGIGAGDADTLIPLLDLLNHHDFGSFSAYLRKPGAIEPFQASDIEAYVKQATFNYEAVRFIVSRLRHGVYDPPNCFTVTPHQGDEVWAKYFDVGNANEPVQGSALSPSSCNEIILNTCATHVILLICADCIIRLLSTLAGGSATVVVLRWGFVLPGGTHDCVKVWVNLGMRESYNEPAGQARFAAQENALVGLAPLIPVRELTQS